MVKRRAFYIFLIIFFIFFSFCQISNATGVKIFLNGKNISSNCNPIEEDGQILVKARPLAASIKADVKWIQSIKTLEIKKGGLVAKMMVDSPYLQLGQKTIKAGAKMVIKNGHTYIPLLEIVKAFGYVVNYTEAENAYYILKPKSMINKIYWRKEGQELVIKMDKLSPYRIRKSSGSKKLLLEIDRATLSSNFKDGISNNNFYLKINRVENKACLQVVIKSKYPIPFQRDGGVEEEGNSIILKFLPHITAINWLNNKTLEVAANGKIHKPDIFYLKDPRRMVLDIPALMLSDYELNLEQNQWIKDIRVSQFKYDPVTLRVVLELKEGKYLNIVKSNDNNKFILKPTVKTRISDLSFRANSIEFISSNPIEPKLFTLTNPDRLVIDLINAYRKEGFPEKLEVNKELVKQIRTSRFEEDIVRIVADLGRITGFNWKQSNGTGGKYKHRIILQNQSNSINLEDRNHNTSININLSGKVNYEVKKFSFPDRIVVDIKSVNVNFGSLKLPEPVGIINDIRTSKYSDDGIDMSRIIFEIEDYNGYEVLSETPAKLINISLVKDRFEDLKNIIIIDAGHGGFDPGAMGPSGLAEKKVNLDLALRVKKLLADSGYNILLTRNKDEFISLHDRVKIANEVKARLFVSIHCNSSNKDYSEGTEVFIAPDKTGSSMGLAEIMQGELLDELNLLDRGVKEENFYVIKNTDMPAVLLEIAFLSNPHEETLLSNELFRERAASAVARGILKYMQKQTQ